MPRPAAKLHEPLLNGLPLLHCEHAHFTRQVRCERDLVLLEPSLLLSGNLSEQCRIMPVPAFRHAPPLITARSSASRNSAISLDNAIEFGRKRRTL